MRPGIPCALETKRKSERRNSRSMEQMSFYQWEMPMERKGNEMSAPSNISLLQTHSIKQWRNNRKTLITRKKGDNKTQSKALCTWNKLRFVVGVEMNCRVVSGGLRVCTMSLDGLDFIVQTSYRDTRRGCHGKVSKDWHLITMIYWSCRSLQENVCKFENKMKRNSNWVF